MATATAGQPPGSDAVGVAPSQPKKGYSPEIFNKKEDRDKFSCGFCTNILRDPVQANCGHRFCEICKKAIEESCNAGQSVICKFCQEEGLTDSEGKLDPNQMYPDRGIRREMISIPAKCPNELCPFRQPFKEYVKHEEVCQYQPLICDKCGEPVSKQKMDQHKNRECPQRVIKCDHCSEAMPFAQKENHLKECPKVPEACSQCNQPIPREKMRRHQSHDCPNRTVSCPLEDCNSPPQPHTQFQQHVQKEQVKHLTWVVSRVGDLDTTLTQLMEPSSPSTPGASGGTPPLNLRENLDNCCRKVEDLQRQLQEHQRAAGESGGGGGAEGGTAVASGGAEESASTSSGNPIERVNTMEIKVNSLEPILSVLHGEMNRCIGAIEALEAQLHQERTKTQENQQKLERYESTINALSTSLTQREAKMKELETRLISLSQDKPDGTMLWKISNFSQVRQDALSGTVTNIHSRPFFSGPTGYKMTVRLYPLGDGLGKNTHMSLFFSIMRGPHDALLPWPFTHKVYFMLIDQNFKKHIIDAFRSEPNSSSFRRPTSEMNIATGCPMFMQLSKLHQPGHAYLKDDTMYIRIVVETEGLQDHLKQFDPRNVPLSNSGSNTS